LDEALMEILGKFKGTFVIELEVKTALHLELKNMELEVSCSGTIQEKL
jgi:hypothetical protein